MMPAFFLLAFLPLAPARAASREAMDVVVLLDNSGSMAKNSTAPGNDERFMRVTAVQYLLEKMAPGDRIGLVTFDSVVHTDPAASRLRDVGGLGMPQAFTQGVRTLTAAPNDSTDMAAGFHAAERILKAGGGAHRRRFLLFLTDGTPNPLRGENTVAGLEHLAGTLGREGIVIHTIGLGQLSLAPKEADAARTLLREIARQGSGDTYAASRAEDLPPLFGSIFARLAGHEITRSVPAGTQAQFSLAPGTHNLRVLATSEGAPPELRLTDPQGKTYPARVLSPLLPGRQTARIAVDAINGPALGTWTAQATRGSLEVAWEPDFEAVLLAPDIQKPVPALAPLALNVALRQRGTSLPAALARGRVVAEYDTTPPQTLTLSEDPANPSHFTGTLADSGAAGAHHLTLQCFRSDAAKAADEEEGGPAYAVVQAERLPVLSLLAPAPDAAYALPGPVPIRAQVLVDGQPPASGGAGLAAQARLQGPAGATQAALTLGADGVFSGAVPAGATPGAASLTVTLFGRFGGRDLSPQTATRAVTLTPTPTVRIQWPASPPLTVDSDDTVLLNADVSSSAGTAQTVFLTCSGPSVVSVVPATLIVPANQTSESVPVRLHLRGVRPGAYTLTLAPRMGGTGVVLEAAPWHDSLHVRTWLERNRWWLYPALALALLLALLTTALVILWLREQARRRQKMLSLLNGAAVYVPGTTHAYHPPSQRVLARTSYTFGGEGADVPIPDPERPGQPLFAEPRLRVAVEWDRRERKPVLRVTPEGSETQFFERDGRLIGEPITPTEGGSSFRVAPEQILVRVNSEWTL